MMTPTTADIIQWL